MEEDQEGRRRRSGGGGRWKGGRDRWKRRRVVASSHLSPAVRLVSVFVEVDHDPAAGVYEGPPGGVLPRQPGRLDAHVVLQIAEPRPPARVDDVGDAHPSLLHDHVVQAVQREATVRRHEATTQRALPTPAPADEDERGRGRARGTLLEGARARGRTRPSSSRKSNPRAACKGGGAHAQRGGVSGGWRGGCPGDGGGGAEPEDVTTDHLSRVSASQRSRPRARLPLRLVITVFARRSRITTRLIFCTFPHDT